jgi:hypothetical protein
MTPLEQAQQEFEQETAKLAQIQNRLDSFASELEKATQAKKNLGDATFNEQLKSYGELGDLQRGFDDVFEEFEQQKALIADVEHNLTREQHLAAIQELDQHSQQHYQAWLTAMQVMADCLATQAPQAMSALRQLMANRQAFLQHANAIVPGVAQASVPLAWDLDRVEKFNAWQATLLSTLQKRGVDLTLLRNPYEGLQLLVDESGNMPLPSVGIFTDVLWQACEIAGRQNPPKEGGGVLHGERTEESISQG